VLARCRGRWLADHRLIQEGADWTHSPAARLWVLVREAG
jgi:hypothetical protein